MFADRHFHRSGRWHSAVDVVTPPTDTVAPTITSGPTVSAIDHDSATVSWGLDEAATGIVGYGTTAPGGTAIPATLVQPVSITGTTGVISIPKASFTLQAGDVVCLFFGRGAHDTAYSQVSPTSGWTFAFNDVKTTTEGQQTAFVYKAISAPGSEPTNWEFTRGSDINPWSCVGFVVRDVEPTPILDAAGVGANGQNDGSPDAPDITTTVDNVRVVTCWWTRMASGSLGSTTITVPSGFTELGRSVVSAALAIVAEKAEATAGAKTYGSWATSPDAATWDFAVFTVGFRPLTTGAAPGTVRASDYTHLSTFEGQFLTSHIQALSGLSEETEYHYVVESQDEAGNVVTSADDTFTTLAAPGGGGGGLYPTPVTGLTVNSVPFLASPGYLSEVADPTFEGSITRISNTDGWRNQYAKIQAWNADGTHAGFFGYGNRIIHGQTYQDLGSMPGIGRPHWAHTNPNWIYNSSNGNPSLMRYDITTGVNSVVRTFSNTAGVDLGWNEGSQSDDDRIFPMGYTVSTGEAGIICYDRVANVELGRGIINSSRTGIDWVGASHDGLWLVVRFNSAGSGTSQGIWLFNQQCVRVRQLTTAATHADIYRAADGSDWIAFYQSGGIQGRKLSSAASVTILSNAGAFATSTGHISGRAFNRPGYIYVSHHTFSTQSVAGFDQIISVKTDGSQEVERWCHARTWQASYQYDRSTHAVPNQDGTKVMWGGRWNDTGGMYSFVVRVAP